MQRQGFTACMTTITFRVCSTTRCSCTKTWRPKQVRVVAFFNQAHCILPRHVIGSTSCVSRLQKPNIFGVEFHELSVKEASDFHPLINFSGIRCVMFEPDGGNVDPSGVTHAYAHGARSLGADIHRFTPVIGTHLRTDKKWDVETTAGTIVADTVVNAAGLWAREVAKLAGLELPLMTMEHQYFVTEDIPEIAQLRRRLPSGC